MAKNQLFSLMIMGSILSFQSLYGQVKDSTTDSMDCCGSICKAPSRTALIKGKNSSTKKGKDTAQMVLIKAGSFNMGSEHYPDSKPVHSVSLDAFYMDVHEVTNDQFAQFVKETNYITIAERAIDPKEYPDIPADQLAAGSAVFTPPNHEVSLNNPMNWWTFVHGADWRHPEGPNSNIIGKGNYPVVQVCYEDCAAYATWAGKRLPTEAEWEYAAKGGNNYPDYYWGAEKTPNGRYMANNFQGIFPYDNTKKDGYLTTAPIEQFPKNPFGIYDLEGNVWEWCSDFYRPDYYGKSPTKNPQGPTDSYDPEELTAIKRVQRGGSFLCSDDYCMRYKAGARGKGEVSSAGNNLGFRCVKSL